MGDVRRSVAWVLAGGLAAWACAKVPYTDRSAFNAIPDGIMNQLGAQTYAEELAANTVVQEGPDKDRLTTVGQRIAAVADQSSFDWQFNLLDSGTMNAWCLPGGYIAFYTGILPVLQSEAGMSFVMGHEVGHAVARHGAERMTQQAGITGALSLIDLLLSGSSRVTEQQRGLVLGALGLGAQYGVALPFSRKHESEADQIGMMLMAQAGYPPDQSMGVWERLGALGGESPPEFTSTHPSHETRIAQQRGWLPEANKAYERADKPTYDTTVTTWQPAPPREAPPEGSAVPANASKKQATASATDTTAPEPSETPATDAEDPEDGGEAPVPDADPTAPVDAD